MRTATAKNGAREVDNLELHHQMYERRMRILKERETLPNYDPRDVVNDPELLKEEPADGNEG